jgi:hypothetical protein
MKKFRHFAVKELEVRALADNEEVIRIAISTETPYLRDRLNGHRVGYEVLGHRSDEVDMTYLQDGAPFLFEHRTDTQIGVLENIELDTINGVLRADVRFSSSQFAQDILEDIKRGIRKRISVGYEVWEYADVGEAEDGIPVVRATKWRPFEASLVSIPADLNAGVNKHFQISEEQTMAKMKAEPVVNEETVPEIGPEDLIELANELLAVAAELIPETEPETEPETPAEEAIAEDDYETLKAELETIKEMLDINEVEEVKKMNIVNQLTALKAAFKETKSMSTKANGSVGANKETIERLTNLAVRHNMTDRLPSWLSEGRSYESVAAEVLDARSNESKIGAPAIHIKGNRDESFAGAVSAWLKGENSEIAERGLDQARAAGNVISAGTLYLPTNVPLFKKAMFRTTFGMGGTGVNATGKEFLTFEETLREGALLARVGGDIRTLNDTAQMPFFSTPTTASNYAETGSVAAAAVQIGLKTWEPKRIAARYEFSNLLGRLNGTYDFEGELYNDLVAEGVRQMDAQIWGGTGANNQLLGIARDTNITSLNQSGSMTLASASVMVTQVAKQNGNVEAGAFVVAHDVYSSIYSTPSFGAGSGESVLSVIQASNPVFRTGYLPEITAGKKVAIFGDFSKVTAAVFGPVEIKRDDLTALANGKTILNLEMFADVAVRQPGSLVRWIHID